jgi:hypothetical protein
MKLKLKAEFIKESEIYGGKEKIRSNRIAKADDKHNIEKQKTWKEEKKNRSQAFFSWNIT